MRGIPSYEVEYNVYHKYIDIYGNEYTNDIKTKSSVLKNSFLTYYYDFQMNDFGRRTCSYATFPITELENFDIMELPKDLEDLEMMFGKPSKNF